MLSTGVESGCRHYTTATEKFTGRSAWVLAMGFAIQWNKRITALTLVMFPVLLSLGVWQLDRAQQKRNIQWQFEQRRTQPPLALEALLSDESLNQSSADENLAHAPVALQGHFDNQHVILLDNQVVSGQVGYDLLQPFLASDGSGRQQWFLVNRGWVKAPPTRDRLPDIPAVPGADTTVNGRVYVPPGQPLQLAAPDWSGDHWPRVVQVAAPDKIGELMQQDFFPWQIRLAETDPNALNTHWQLITVLPEKHQAYAVQWFAMAAALVIWFLFANSNLWQLTRRRKMPND